MRYLATLAAVCLVLQTAGLPATAQIMPGQVDDFEQGGTQGWQEGASPNPPQVMASGGPDGPDDSFLRNQSGGAGPGSRMIMFNGDPRWRGDYVDAGISALEVDLNNLGTVPLTMRFDLVRGNPQINSEHVFTQGFEIQPGSGWQTATFSLAMDDLFSSGDMSGILGNVSQLRLIHEPGASPAHPPNPVNGVLGIDNIRAVGAPIMEDLPGDYSGNGLVEQADLDLVLGNWGADAANVPATWVSDPPEGFVDQAELDKVLGNWGRTNAATASALPLGGSAVPEPAAVLLAAVIGLVALCVGRVARRRELPARGVYSKAKVSCPAESIHLLKLPQLDSAAEKEVGGHDFHIPTGASLAGVHGRNGSSGPGGRV